MHVPPQTIDQGHVRFDMLMARDIPGLDDVIEEEATPKKYATDPFASTPAEIKQNEELAEGPLIDEPVTGADNDDLWIADQGETDIEDDDEDEEVLEPAE